MAGPIAEVARMSGVTARTLRHYDEIGLLAPAWIGANGHRYYEERQPLRLQQVLVLRALGVGLPEIGRILAAQVVAAEPGEQRVGRGAWIATYDSRRPRQGGPVGVCGTCRAVGPAGCGRRPAQGPWLGRGPGEYHMVLSAKVWGDRVTPLVASRRCGLPARAQMTPGRSEVWQ